MPAKLTTQKFIEKASKKHNNFYDYSLVNYKKANIKVKIICPKHGVFEQQPNNHLFGQGCIGCMGDNVRKARKLTHFEFIEKLLEKHPETLNLIKFKEEYKGNNIKLLVEDKYGKLKITPRSLLNGSLPNIGNAIDKKEYLLNYIKYNNIDFYQKINKIITDNKFINYSNKIKISTIYGIIELSLDSIMRGNGFDIRSSTNKKEYILKYLEIHHPKYIENKIELVSDFEGCMSPLKVKYKGKEYITTSDALFRGVFSGEKNIGVFINKIVENNKENLIKKECFVYKIKLFNEEENFYKIGISVNPELRFRSIPYNIEVIELISTNSYNAYYIEQNYHQLLKEYKYEPKNKFAGQTECFNKII